MKYFLTHILMLLCVCVFGQRLHIKPGVDTLDLEVQKSLEFYRAYLNEFKGVSIPQNSREYWSQKECGCYVGWRLINPISTRSTNKVPKKSLCRS